MLRNAGKSTDRRLTRSLVQRLLMLTFAVAVYERTVVPPVNVIAASLQAPHRIHSTSKALGLV